MGGDEFVVLIDGGDLQVAPELVAERLLDVMRQPFELDERGTPLIVNDQHRHRRRRPRQRRASCCATPMSRSTRPRRPARTATRSSDPRCKRKIQHRIELEFDLRSALEGDQFRLVYQPIYNLDDLTLVGVEALLRWQHPTLGLVQPDEFIPILEQTGQIGEVGRWVLQQGLRADGRLARPRRQRSTSRSTSRAANSTTTRSSTHIRDALDDQRPRPAVADHRGHRNRADAQRRHDRPTTQAIKALGVRIAVDDFGTGYSSLAYLQQFPVDCLKIDRIFTNAITTSPESKALIGTLVQLGKDLGLTTLAEGVETTDEMDHLRGEHVNEAQGFLRQAARPRNHRNPTPRTNTASRGRAPSRTNDLNARKYPPPDRLRDPPVRGHDRSTLLPLDIGGPTLDGTERLDSDSPILPDLSAFFSGVRSRLSCDVR